MSVRKIIRQSKLDWVAPLGLYQCKPVTLRWTGGTAPFTLLAEPSGPAAIPSIKTIASGDGVVSPFIWVVDIPGGTSFDVVLSDATGSRVAWFRQVVNTTSTACLSSTSSTTTDRGSSTSGFSMSAPTSSPIVGGSSSIPSVSSGSSTIASATAGVTPGSSVNVAALGGGVGGGVAILIALTLLVIWRIRKARRARAQSDNHMDLTDMSINSCAETEVEPYPSTSHTLSSSELLAQRTAHVTPQGNHYEVAFFQPAGTVSQADQPHVSLPLHGNGDVKAQRAVRGNDNTQAPTIADPPSSLAASEESRFTMNDDGPLVPQKEGTDDPPPLYGL